ncbi:MULTISPECIES: hypothetical protein [Clostridia]|uniref:hypothetical protein n=1 Tax=Clostridia TaxID=186801 RepID=UPI0012ECCAA0|nr:MULTISPECIES: hypothetical protein [Clostridia]MDU5291770.1 hypothetical protein [Clostridium sp.]
MAVIVRKLNIYMLFIVKAKNDKILLDYFLMQFRKNFKLFSFSEHLIYKQTSLPYKKYDIIKELISGRTGAARDKRGAGWRKNLWQKELKAERV